MKILESAPERYDRGISMLTRGRIGEVYERIAQSVAAPGKRILDIGCGTGGVSFACAARGAMVNVASTRALQSEPHTEAYSASKGGVVALSHALAMSLAPQVRVNCVSPGWIDVGRRGAPALRAADHAQHPAGHGAHGAHQGIAVCSHHRDRDRGLPVPGVPGVLGRNHAAAGEGIHRHG